MALKALLLKKKIDTKRKELAEIEARGAELIRRGAELEAAIGEAETEEEQTAVMEEISAYTAESEQFNTDVENLNEEIRGLEAELAETEAEQITRTAEPPVEEVEKVVVERRENKDMVTRRLMNMSAQETRDFIEREDVKAFLGEVRSCIKEKRALSNVGTLVPEVMIGLIRENIMEYSKLYKHVAVRQVGGDARAVIMGVIPEAVWTDCCANLNELDLGFYDLELGCWKVGGYYPVCNATLEDSDIALASELLTALGQSIGIALDKAILYGLGTRMPLGVVTRLAQTSEPAGYPATAYPWVDLHSTNLVPIGTSATGAELIAAIVNAFGAAKGKYSRGEKVFVMNEKTYTAIASATVNVNGDGAFVAGVLDRMPVVGGIIEVLDFIPDGVIVAGYFDLFVLAERAGSKFASSEHVKFLADQTVFKGTARYDGAPAIPEGFVLIYMGNSITSAETAIAFAPDTANDSE